MKFCTKKTYHYYYPALLHVEEAMHCEDCEDTQKPV